MGAKAPDNSRIIGESYREKKPRKVKGDKFLDRPTLHKTLRSIEEESNDQLLDIAGDNELVKVFEEEHMDPQSLRKYAHSVSPKPARRVTTGTRAKSSLGFSSSTESLPTITARSKHYTSSDNDLDAVSQADVSSTTSVVSNEKRRKKQWNSSTGLSSIQHDAAPPVGQSLSEIPVTSVSVSHLVTASAMFPLDQAMKAWMDRTVMRAGEHHHELFHDLFRKASRVFTRCFRDMKEVASPKTVEHGGIFLQLWKCFSEVFEICQTKLIELARKETRILDVTIEKNELEKQLEENSLFLEEVQTDLYETNTRRLALEDEIKELRRLIDPEWDEDRGMTLKRSSEGGHRTSHFGRGERAELEARIEEMRKEISYRLGESSNNARRVREELEREKRKMHEENHRRNQKAKELEKHNAELEKENEQLRSIIAEKDGIIATRTPRPAWHEMNLSNLFNKVPQEFVTTEIVMKLMEEVKRLRDQLSKYQRILVEPLGDETNGSTLAQRLLLKYDGERKKIPSEMGRKSTASKPPSRASGEGLKVPPSPGAAQARQRRSSVKALPSSVGRLSANTSSSPEPHGLGAFSLDDIVEGALSDGFFTSDEILAKIREKISGPEDAQCFTGLGISTRLPKFLRYRGKVRIHTMSKRETEMMARDVWEKKQQFDQQRGHGQNGDIKTPPTVQAQTGQQQQQQQQQQCPMRMSEYFLLYLQNRFGNFPSVVAEWAYSLIDSLDKFKYDADCRILLKVLLDEVDEVVVHDQKGMVEKLEKALLRADMQENNQKLSERLSKKTIMDVVEKTFAHKTKDMIVALRESLNKDFQEDPVDYGRLFDEDANGDQGEFAELLRTQYFEDRENFSAEIEQSLYNMDVKKTGYICAEHIRMAIMQVDLNKPVTEINAYLERGFGLPMEKIKPDSEIPISLFLKRLNRGVLKRSSTKALKLKAWGMKAALTMNVFRSNPFSMKKFGDTPPRTGDAAKRPENKR